MNVEQIATDWKDYQAIVVDYKEWLSVIEKQRDDKIEEFHSIHPVEVLDQAVEEHLQEHGFRRVIDVSFVYDVFGNFKRFLARNPAYVSDEGYIFTTSNRFKNLRYELHQVESHHVKSTDNLDKILQYLTGHGHSEMPARLLGGAVLGGAIGGFNGYVAGMLGACAGMLVATLYVCISITAKQPLQYRKRVKEIACGTYDTITKLAEIGEIIEYEPITFESLGVWWKPIKRRGQEGEKNDTRNRN